MFFRPHFLEVLGDKLFEINHPIASMLTMPITVFLLFISVLWSISAVGKHGIIPAVALGICIILMHLLYGIVSKGVMFVWIQPFICYAELIFIKYVFRANDDDPGVGLIGWIVFAIITLLLFVYTANCLDIVDSMWGIMYILPYAMAWIYSLKHQHYVYYFVVYLLLYAIVISVYSFLRKRKNKDFEIADGSFLAGFLLVAFSVMALTHAMMDGYNMIANTPIDLAVTLLEMKEL